MASLKDSTVIGALTVTGIINTNNTTRSESWRSDSYGYAPTRLGNYDSICGSTSATKFVSIFKNGYVDSGGVRRCFVDGYPVGEFTVNRDGFNFYGSTMAVGANGSVTPKLEFQLLNGVVSFFGNVAPNSTLDNTKSLGFSFARWSTIYAGTGAINTSDERYKVFYDTDEAEKSAALEIKSIIKKFKFKDAIAEKGEENARIHYGVGAQSVVSILQKHGLNPFDYAFVCYDKWDAIKEVKDETGVITQQARTAGDKYGIRYEELAMFILGAM